MTLSKRRRDILEFIEDHTARLGYAPSIREIGNKLNLKSPATVKNHIDSLVREGYLRRLPHKARSLVVEKIKRPSVVEIPLIGSISAGKGADAIEDLTDFLYLPETLVGKSQTIALRVKGDSMIGAGIFDKDIAIIRRTKVESGQIGAVMLPDGQATIKRIKLSNRSATLIPENPAYEPQNYGLGEIEIFGPLVGLIRKY